MSYAVRVESFADRLGRCFELAANYVMHADERLGQDVALVHGQIRSERADVDRIEHAWVVVDPGGSERVFDPVLAETWPADAYARFAAAVEHRRFTPDEMRVEMVRRCHYGPWAGPGELPAVDPEWCDNCGHARGEHGDDPSRCALCRWEAAEDAGFVEGDEVGLCGGFEQD